MSIAAGTRLGAYRIIAPLGAGGMGQVYRAHDDRLNRDLAIKVLPPEFVGDADRRWRFENEARAASALNHPNVLHIYEIGSAEGVFYIAMELVEGRTLREVVSAGPMPVKKLLDVAIPVSDGLAKAHAAGIVHRDLKPENVMISNDGFVKILDFGLAKLVTASHSDPNSPTQAHVTQSGALVGTVSYMSPEQASGRQADFRSDQFSLGTMLYEMAAGRRPFAKSSAAQTLTAIIESEPEPLNAVAPAVPPALQRIIERCLSKEPEGRYHSTADLARDLRDVREYGSQVSGVAAAVTKRPRFGWRLGAAMAAGAIAVALLATLAAAKFMRKPSVEFVRLTFDRGIIWNARFAPDGETIVYGGAWAGKPFEIYSARVGAPEPRPLGIPNSDILAISPAGELAISLTPHFFQTFQMKGTLAHAPLGGGTPRPVLEGVQWADWAPDGKNLAVVREVAGRSRLEFPVGKVLYETGGWIGHVRVSPDGTLVALVNHPVYTDVSGSVVIVDTTGHRVASSKLWTDVEGVAWTPTGKEVWFSSSLSGTSTHTINALTPNGSQRVVMDFPADVKVQDIDRFGRLLFAREEVPFLITALPPGASAEQDASVFGNSVSRDISPDGSTLLVLASTEGGANHAVYLRRFDGSAPARIGEGLPSDLSPDGTWALAVLPVPAPAQLFRIPTGIGEPAPLTRDQITHSWANIFPDGKRILFLGHSPGHGNQLFVQNISGGEPRAISPEGTAFQWHAIAPDNRRIAAWGPDHAITIYDADGGASVRTPLPGDDEPIRWTADGKSLYVFRRGEFPAKIYRANITTGEKTLWRELMPSDSAGLESILRIQITPDERAYAYSRVVRLSTLYVATGIR